MADGELRLSDLKDDEIEVERREEELSLSGLQDTDYEVEEEAYSEAEAAALGAVQGATFGFGDELEGAVRTVPRGLEMAQEALGFGGDEPQSKEGLLETYRSLRDAARARNISAQEQNPLSYLGGEFAGGMAIPGLGMAKAGKTALQAGKAALQAGKGAKTARTLAGLKKAQELSKVGAKTGAALGLGAGQADITKGEIPEALEEMASSAVMGGIAAPVLSAAPGAIKGAGKFLKESVEEFPIVGPALRGARVGARGQGITTKAGRDASERVIERQAKEIDKGVQESLSKAAEQKADILKNAKGTVEYAELADEIAGGAAEVKRIGLGSMAKGDAKMLSTIADDLEFKDNDPMTADKMRAFLANYTSLGDKSLQTKEGRKAALAAVYSMKEKIGKAVGDQRDNLENANQRISKLLKAAGILKTDTPSLSELDDIIKVDKLSDLMSRLEKTGASGIKARMRLRAIKGALKETDPEVAKKVEKSLNEGADLIQALADSGADVQGMWQTFTKKIPTYVGNITGRGAEKTKNLADISRRFVSDSLPDDLTKMANSLTKKYGEKKQHFVNLLNEASKLPERRRQAVLFSLMQQEEFRDLLNEQEGTVDE